MKQFFTIALLSILSFHLVAQDTQVSPDRALDLFKQGNYEEALPMYQQLIERYDRDAKYNYYLGVCLVEQKHHLSEAIKRLKFALSRRINKDVHFYLGKAYQKTYEFELAKKEFENFLKYATNNDLRRIQAQKAVNDCQTAGSLINKHFSIQVVDKDTIADQQILSMYNLPEDAGSLLRNKSFFKTGVPPENIMYRTEKGDDVYFVMEEPDTTLHDIYFMERLLDRWSGSKNLGEPVNSDYDDRHPFLMVDGTTFFFSSDRPGGMGGMDVYRTIFDPVSDSFSEPENLGVPFNSPDDDYLFAADPFGERAWFSTNRGVIPGQIIVVKIVWDSSVIKNLTTDINQIRDIANLPLSEGNFWEDQIEKEQKEKNGSQEDKTEQFQFYINDTLIYTNYDHFHSDVARAEFKRGQKVDMQKDSLEQLMRNKREQYAQSYNQEELSRLMDEILELEKTVYGHDDQVKRHYIRARQMEIDKISELKAKGIYNSYKTTSSSSTSVKTDSPSSSLKSAGYIFYTTEEFQVRKERLMPVYKRYFAPGQIQVLQQTDSMYTWANILQLEASKLLESSVTSTEEDENQSLLDKVRNIDSLKKSEEENPEPVSQQAREMQHQALSMYHDALDKKFNIYKPVIEQLAENSGTGKWDNLLAEAQSRFEQANNGIDKMMTWNPERYEQLGGLKRQAIEMIEETFLNHQTGDNATIASSDNSRSAGKRTATEVKTKPTTKSSQTKIPEVNNATEMAQAAFQKTEKKAESTQPVYKIQIGVFRNTPDPEALAKIPEISSQPVPGKDITRYYSGQWKTYSEAARFIEKVRGSGFPGAFVVAFLDGEKIPVERAKKLSGE